MLSPSARTPEWPGTLSEREKAIVLILVGPPGSGKTTFCNDVMAAARRSWVRICQDTIANGKAGTKSQCLKSATEALKDRKSIFVDRCNLDIEQRSEFVKLGGPHVEVHALVFDLPTKLCISRSVKRTGHEGNLQGGRAAAVVNRMLQKKQLPKLTEGFSRITCCQNENDVQSTVNTYRELGPEDTLPSGCFGQKNTDNKVQLGIMKFLKKVEPPEERVPKNSDVEAEKADNIPTKMVELLGGSSTNGFSSSDMDVDRSAIKITEKGSQGGSSSGGFSADDVPTLAFPSISTSDFQFDHEKASDIIVEKVEELLNKVIDIRLVLVDLSHSSHILSLVGSKATKKNLDTSKFFTVVGDITKLYTEKGFRCNVIANAANWRLKPGGGGVNAAIFSAAGEALESATKERASSLSPGNAVAVPLPSTSPLRKREGVTHVIHVLGPNMNPQRPNCLKNDYIQGCEILHQAYSSLFDKFASIARTLKGTSEDVDLRSSESHGNPSNLKPTVQFLNSEQKNKREDVYDSERNKKCKGLPLETAKLESNFDASKIDGNKKKSGSWAKALYNIAMNPDSQKDGVLEVSNDFVVLNDLYPKAKKHLLILARVKSLDQIADVRKDHLPLIREMHSMGCKWAKKEISDDPSLVFRLGYHSVPSMRQLHLHVISQDFDSLHLKNKKHWNSFNTPFFLDAVDVIEKLDKHGKAMLNDESLLSMELRCHRCRSAHPNIPRLKAHISKCQAPFPTFLQQNGRLVTGESLETEL